MEINDKTLIFYNRDGSDYKIEFETREDAEQAKKIAQYAYEQGFQEGKNC